VTARPTAVDSEIFELNFLTAAAPKGCCAVSSNFISQSRPGSPAAPMYVSPLPTPAKAGQLIQVTSAVLASPSSTHGTRYLYDLAYQSPDGTVAPQRFVVRQASVATENARYYSADTSHGYLSNFPAFPVNREIGSTDVLPAETFPTAITTYLTANPALTWSPEYIQAAPNFNFNGGQYTSAQTFRPGQRFTDNWGEYPLHPSSAVLLPQTSHQPPVQATATRSGDSLAIGMNSFTDNTPGHLGLAVNPPFQASGSYQIDQNGTKVAGGALPRYGDFQATATLTPKPSLIKVAMTATEPAKLNPLSTTNSTVWTWPSAHESSGTLPPGWACATSRITRSCTVQPLLTLRYNVAGENLSGATTPGQQTVRLSVGHLQLTKAAKITGVTVSVSFDGGKTWHQAKVTGTGGSYTAAFSAPAGALVTMRTAATDAAGASITQTITDAYQTATQS
jgi:hypothetical protein